MAGPINHLRSVIRGYFTRQCATVDDMPLAIAQDTTRKAKSRKRIRNVAPSERFVWAMVLLIIALIGLIALEALYICVTKSVSAELFAAISALSGSVATAFLVGETKMINIMFLVFASFILGATCYTAYAYMWQRRCKGGFSWLNLVSLLVSLAIDVTASPLLNVPGAVPLVLFGLGSGYIMLSSFAFGVMVNFFVAKPLAYFSGKSSFNAGRGRTAGFWGRRASDLTVLKQPVTRKFRRLWLVILALLIIVPAGYAIAILQFQATINTHGNIKSVGVAFYTDSAGVSATSQIDWGTLERGQTANVTLYMKSQINVSVSVSMAVGNFNPASGASYLACTWNYGGGTLNPGQLVAVTFTLTVANTITGITSFSFDIGVVGVAR